LPPKSAFEAADPIGNDMIPSACSGDASRGNDGSGVGSNSGNRRASASQLDLADDGYLHAFRVKSRSSVRQQSAKKPLDHGAQEALAIKFRRDLFLALASGRGVFACCLSWHI